MNPEARQALLDDAALTVTQDRNGQYGEPEDAFARIAALWTAYTGRHFTRTDVAAMMILMKTARLAHSPQNRDSWLDVAGYAACGWSSAIADVT